MESSWRNKVLLTRTEMKNAKASTLEVAESSWQNLAHTHPGVLRAEARTKSAKTSDPK
jgi:hypothetical protein